MKPPIATLLVLAVLAAASPAARAQDPAPAAAPPLGAPPLGAPPLGAKVQDGRGKPVGKVEKIIADKDGRPVQVLVRVDRVLRTLPVEALTPRRDGVYVAVLSRAEIVALPPSD
jgi:hypothetical protein